MSKTSSDLKGDALIRWNLIPTSTAALVDFDRAVTGPGIVRAPSSRVMTGAINAAQATEQATLAAGANKNLPINELGQNKLAVTRQD